MDLVTYLRTRLHICGLGGGGGVTVRFVRVRFCFFVEFRTGFWDKTDKTDTTTDTSKQNNETIQVKTI